MEELIRRGANVNARARNGSTALHGAVAAPARVLLAAGAILSARDDEGFTALHKAAEAGDAELVRVLANAPGADVNDRGHAARPGSFLGSPLGLAVAGAHFTCIRILALYCRARLDVEDDAGLTPVDRAYIEHAHADPADVRGFERALVELVLHGAALQPSEAALQEMEDARRPPPPLLVAAERTRRAALRPAVAAAVVEGVRRVARGARAVPQPKHKPDMLWIWNTALQTANGAAGLPIPPRELFFLALKEAAACEYARVAGLHAALLMENLRARPGLLPEPAFGPTWLALRACDRLTEWQHKESAAREQVRSQLRDLVAGDAR